jgi:nucleoside-diphosphate-sugar epimerase
LRGVFPSDESFAWLRECDLILHLAARSGVVACANDPEGTWKVNVDGTAQLVEFCRRESIPVAIASSFSVVGVPDKLPIREGTPPRPPHAYAQQKAEGEKLVRSLRTRDGALGAVVRMSNIFGIYELHGQKVTKGNVLNQFAEQALAGGPLKVFAPGTQRRDYIHIDDVAAHWEAVARYLMKGKHQGEVPTFNVASGESRTVIELSAMVLTAWKALYPDRPALTAEVVDNPRAHVEILHPEFTVDAEWTRKTLGVRCQKNLKSGVLEILGSGQVHAKGSRASMTR